MANSLARNSKHSQSCTIILGWKTGIPLLLTTSSYRSRLVDVAAADDAAAEVVGYGDESFFVISRHRVIRGAQTVSAAAGIRRA